MKMENDLNYDLLKIKLTIEERLLELTRYLDEMPSNVSDTSGGKPEINNLSGFYHSLDTLLYNYTTYHGCTRL